MPNKLVEQLLERSEIDKQDSDFTYFWSLLLVGEALVKTIALGMLAAVEEDTQRNKYRLCHKLVRADGIGDWSDAIADAVSGPASQFLIAGAQEERLQLNKNCEEGDWQFEAVTSLKRALDACHLEGELIGRRTDLKRWFRLFSTLRNKTRGHGATRPSDGGEAAGHLLQSISLICDNFSLFHRPWAYLYRNLSGKYRVTALSIQGPSFENLKRESWHSLPNGVYVDFGEARMVPLLASDQELSDFYFPNGSFKDKNYELLSYVTDNKTLGDSGPYIDQPVVLESETHGYGDLLPRGNSLSNAPLPAKDYVSRYALEEELYSLLVDDRHPVITLQGAGGIGKTTSTLQVVEELYRGTRFDTIVWFSARDIDLESLGPRTVQPGVLSPNDIADQYANLVLSDERRNDKKFNKREFFQEQLQASDGGTSLFVFDNFETMQNPLEMFSWLESYVRLPNKVLITTRLRDFKGDYPVGVHGMTEHETRTLIDQTASQLMIKDRLTDEWKEQVVGQSQGHPYVIKILLGEVANTGKLSFPRRVVAGMDEILTALFERTYEALSPCGQRAFLTLAAWNVAVPRVGLEAVLIHSTGEISEVERGIDSLLHYSLAEAHSGVPDNEEYINLPLVAREYGKKRLQTSPLKSAVQVDATILQMFGPPDTNLNLGKQFERFIRSLSERTERAESYSDYEEIVGMVCRAYAPGWLVLGRWHLERGTPDASQEAIDCFESYLQASPASEETPDAWRLLGEAYFRKRDVLGRINAFVERAQFDSVPFHDVSNTANLLNREYSNIALLPDAKRNLSESLLMVMNARISEALPDDLSRMAWLAIHLDQQEQAKAFVQQGLNMDPENEHCSRIAERLGLSRRMI